jgi:hypothetical protein
LGAYFPGLVKTAEWFRAGYTPAQGLTHGLASPGEFPWTCLVLNQKNDFIGSCAIIPSDFSNNNAKVIWVPFFFLLHKYRGSSVPKLLLEQSLT